MKRYGSTKLNEMIATAGAISMMPEVVEKMPNPELYPVGAVVILNGSDPGYVSTHMHKVRIGSDGKHEWRDITQSREIEPEIGGDCTVTEAFSESLNAVQVTAQWYSPKYDLADPWVNDILVRARGKYPTNPNDGQIIGESDRHNRYAILSPNWFTTIGIRDTEEDHEADLVQQEFFYCVFHVFKSGRMTVTHARRQEGIVIIPRQGYAYHLEDDNKNRYFAWVSPPVHYTPEDSDIEYTWQSDSLMHGTFADVMLSQELKQFNERNATINLDDYTDPEPWYQISGTVFNLYEPFWVLHTYTAKVGNNIKTYYLATDCGPLYKPALSKLHLCSYPSVNYNRSTKAGDDGKMLPYFDLEAHKQSGQTEVSTIPLSNGHTFRSGEKGMIAVLWFGSCANSGGGSDQFRNKWFRGLHPSDKNNEYYAGPDGEVGSSLKSNSKLAWVDSKGRINNGGNRDTAKPSVDPYGQPYRDVIFKVSGMYPFYCTSTSKGSGAKENGGFRDNSYTDVVGQGIRNDPNDPYDTYDIGNDASYYPGDPTFTYIENGVEVVRKHRKLRKDGNNIVWDLSCPENSISDKDRVLLGYFTNVWMEAGDVFHFKGKVDENLRMLIQDDNPVSPTYGDYVVCVDSHGSWNQDKEYTYTACQTGWHKMAIYANNEGNYFGEARQDNGNPVAPTIDWYRVRVNDGEEWQILANGNDCPNPLHFAINTADITETGIKGNFAVMSKSLREDGFKGDIESEFLSINEQVPLFSLYVENGGYMFRSKNGVTWIDNGVDTLKQDPKFGRVSKMIDSSNDLMFVTHHLQAKDPETRYNYKYRQFCVHVDPDSGRKFILFADLKEVTPNTWIALLCKFWWHKYYCIPKDEGVVDTAPQVPWVWTTYHHPGLQESHRLAGLSFIAGNDDHMHLGMFLPYLDRYNSCVVGGTVAAGYYPSWNGSAWTTGSHLPSDEARMRDIAPHYNGKVDSHPLVNDPAYCGSPAITDGNHINCSVATRFLNFGLLDTLGQYEWMNYDPSNAAGSSHMYKMWMEGLPSDRVVQLDAKYKFSGWITYVNVKITDIPETSQYGY